MHLSNYKNNREGNYLLITRAPRFRDLRTKWYTLCSNTFKRSHLELAKPFPDLNMKMACTSLCLVNPSIRKYVEVPAIDAADEPHWWPTKGLGFDSLDDDYKVLAMEYSFPHNVAAVVYSLKYDRWKSIVPPTRRPFRCTDKRSSCVEESTG
ncbi:hypothetical protein Droror1_Dr00024955 [Drosera rotundifolia]